MEGEIKNSRKKLFKKFCKDCDNLFRPKGRHSIYCKNCLTRRRIEKNKRFFEKRRKKKENE